MARMSPLMEDPPTPSTCAGCGALVTARAAFCSQCGQPLRGTAVPAPKKSKWYYNRWVVLLMLTPVALGPLALPFLWKSPGFSRTAKLMLTLITLAWTTAFVWYVMVRVVPAVQNEMRGLQSIYQF